MDELQKEIEEIVCDRCNEIAEVFTDKERIKDICKDVASEILGIMPQWVSVEDRLPEEDGYVMCSNGKWPLPYFIQYAQGVFWDNLLSEIRAYPKYWQPLPQPPKDKP